VRSRDDASGGAWRSGGHLTRSRDDASGGAGRSGGRLGRSSDDTSGGAWRSEGDLWPTTGEGGLRSFSTISPLLKNLLCRGPNRRDEKRERERTIINGTCPAPLP
jgi:hypothetical protein